METPTNDAVVPITPTDLETIIAIIPHLLKSDEAGPAFFIATEEWQTEHNYSETESDV